MPERDDAPYPAGSTAGHDDAGYRPAPDDWREQTMPGLTPVRGAAPGATAYGTPRHRDPGSGGAVFGEPGYDEPADGDPDFVDPGYGEPGYSSAGYGRAEHDHPGYDRPEYDRPGYDPAYSAPGHRGPGYSTPGHAPGSGSPTYADSRDPSARYESARYESPRYESPRYDDTGDHGYPGAPPETTAPEYSSRPVAVRRPDSLAALVLLLAGLAAGVSLVLHWLARRDATGWTLVRDGLRDFGGIFGTGMWQPLAIVLGGGVLFVLGLLALIPARAHRFLGLVALLVTLAIGAGVLVPLADANWRLGTFDVGFFVGIGVAGLGLIGAFKALLTIPRPGRH